MANINRVIITGNLTHEPKLSASKKAASFGLASSTRQKVGDNWEDVTNYFNVVILGQRAESLASYLHKGVKVAIDGSLRYRTYEKDDETRSVVEIVVDNLEFLTPKKKEESDTEPIPFD